MNQQCRLPCLKTTIKLNTMKQYGTEFISYYEIWIFLYTSFLGINIPFCFPTYTLTSQKVSLLILFLSFYFAKSLLLFVLFLLYYCSMYLKFLLKPWLRPSFNTNSPFMVSLFPISFYIWCFWIPCFDV